MTMVLSRPEVVIVGGGIGGLFAANALIAHGLRVSVYEQAPALGEVGAGVFLTPNSVRQLERVGLGPAVEKWGAKVGVGSRYFRHNGAPIAPVQVTDSSGWNATFGMHRADLVEILGSALPAGVVHTGHRCSGFTQDGDVARVVRQWRGRRRSCRRCRGRHALSYGNTSLRHLARSSMGLSLTAACWRMSALRIGRPTAG